MNRKDQQYRGTNYYKDYSIAQAIRDKLQNLGHEQARIVDYQRGWAVQYYLSGPYYPELET